jgi:drug/metabolite transporter (DMT)-like permease
VNELIGIGELAGLTAAALWACSSLFYGRTKLSAWQINFGKNLLASIILCLHLAVVTGLAGRSMFAADRNTWLLLIVSSVIGILIGDTFYFRSLQILGPRRALIVSMTSPLFGAIIGWTVLQESLSLLSIAGILLTLFGIAIVVTERGAAAETPGHFPASMSRGVAMGLLASLCNACGSEKLFASGCNPLEATVIRVCVAAAFCIAIAIVTGQLLSTARKSFDPVALKSYLPAVICGPWLGIWMSQIAYKNSYLAIVLTLTCTTPLFVMPMLRITYGYQITGRAIIGTLVALTGVYLTVA